MTDLQDRRTVMFIGAHSDDEAIVAGTLALHARAGDRVVICIATDGRHAHEVSDPQAAIRVRREEMRASAAVIGATAEMLGLTDGELMDTPGNRAAVVHAIRKHHPDVVATHPPIDYHGDHMALSAMVTQTQCHVAFTHAYPGQHPPCEPPTLYYADSARGIDFEPDQYVDISSTMDIKLRMCRCHRSQYRGDPGSNDMEESLRVQARFRGIQAQVMYAEAYRLYPNIARVRLSGGLSAHRGLSR